MSVIWSLIPTPWKAALGLGALLALGLVAGLAAWKGYNAGYDKAEALGRAAIAELISEHNQAYAAAMAELNDKLQRQARAALVVSGQLEKERINNAKTQANLQKRIAALTAGSGHTFSVGFVGLWNDAVNAAAAAGDALPAAAVAGDAAGEAGAGVAALPRFLGDDAGVTEADILAYIVYYGKRAKNLEAQVNAWIDWAESLKEENERR